MKTLTVVELIEKLNRTDDYLEKDEIIEELRVHGVIIDRDVYFSWDTSI